jgi:malonyl-CoA/methylmalonyl-CoA synthetase
MHTNMVWESLGDCFAFCFLSHGEKKAICFQRDGCLETELSYQELNRDSNRMANTFLEMEVKKGDRVVLYLEKSLGFIVAYLALQKIGAIAVPLNPGLKKSEMSYLLKNVEPSLVLSGPEQAGIVGELNPRPTFIVIPTREPYQSLVFFRHASDVLARMEIRPDDPALIVYTSGTTGKPKGAILTQRNLLHDAGNVIQTWEITESDVLCHVLPLFHVHGLCFALHTFLMTGSRIVMLDRFSAKNVIEVLTRKGEENPCTLFMAVPAMYGMMMDYLGEKTLDFGHVRLWTSGSAPLAIDDFHKIKEVFGKEPVEREGMSETGMNFSNPLRGLRKPGSVGIAMPRLQVRIVDPKTFEDVAPGQTGEIWLKGPCITPGYWRNPGETAEAFEKGWFRTGDLGRVDKDGYYYLADRIKHIIISGGENISPREVESVINRLAGVIESSVVGIPDNQWGEKVVAAVVRQPGCKVSAHEIQAFCKEHLHDWKCPKKILFLEKLPKNRMGKVLKGEIKERFRRGEWV